VKTASEEGSDEPQFSCLSDKEQKINKSAMKMYSGVQ
jgi:hypothetical protein